MSLESAVRLELNLLGLYLTVGLVAAVALHAVGLKRIDPAVQGAGLFFRVLITPGLVALWPLMLARWRAAAAGRPRFGERERPISSRGQRAIHRWLALTLAVLVPLAFGLALALRPGAVTMPRLPEIAEAPLAGAARAVIDRPAAFGETLPLDLRLIDDGVARYAELHVTADPGRPSLWLYWTPQVGETPGRDAVLLGPVGGPGVRRLRIPDGTSDRGGALILYSMIAQRRVGEAVPVPLLVAGS